MTFRQSDRSHSFEFSVGGEAVDSLRYSVHSLKFRVLFLVSTEGTRRTLGLGCGWKPQLLCLLAYASGFVLVSAEVSRVTLIWPAAGGPDYCVEANH